VLGAVEEKVVVACVEVPRMVFISTTEEGGASEISCEACAFVIKAGGTALPRCGVLRGTSWGDVVGE
jgi:hypothetical protein